MKNSLLTLLTLAILPMSAFAATNTICGTAKTINGNNYLVTQKGNVAVSQALLNQANEILVRNFLPAQEGIKYCVNTKVSKAGKVLKVVGAYPQELNITTFCGVRAGSLGLMYLDAPNGDSLILSGNTDVANLDMGEKVDDLLISQYGEGTQNKKSYCVNGVIVNDSLTVLYGAFPN